MTAAFGICASNIASTNIVGGQLNTEISGVDDVADVGRACRKKNEVYSGWLRSRSRACRAALS